MNQQQILRLPSLWLAVLLTMTLLACSDVQKIEINSILDARDQAVSNSDIAAYSKLLLKDYQDHDQTKISVVARMINLFSQFDTTRMQSFDRKIVLLDDDHAQCEQSYHLKVQRGGVWREITQREQLYLIRTSAGWRISGGL